MKVAILAPLPPPSGGIASWAVRMLNTKLKNNWTVSVIDEKLIGRSSHGDQNTKNYYIETKRCLKIWTSLWRTLNDRDVQVVHACTAATTTGMMRDLVSAWITKLKKRKYIIHFRCTIPNLIHGGMKERVFCALCNSSDLVMTLNRQSQEFVLRKTKTETQLVPNFVEDTVANQGANRVYKDSIKTILYTGGVTEEKGCAEIIEAAKQYPEINFRLVGNVRAEIEKLTIPPNVTLTGVQNKQYVQNELDNADAYIFFTHMDSEGFANSLVEAMGAGLPCIVTDWSANADMIENKGGVVLPIHDVDGLIKAITTIKDNLTLRQEMGQWNVKKVLKEYSESVVTSQYVDIYEKLIQ